MIAGLGDARVVMATTRCLPDIGGIESHVNEVATRLQDRCGSLAVLTTDRTGRLPATAEVGGVAVRRFRAYPRRRDYYASPGLFAALLRAPADLVHVQGVHTLVPPIAMLAAILRRKPFVVTFHTGGSSSRFRARSRGVQWRMLAPLLRRADRLVAVSRHEASTFEQVLGLEAGSISVVRNGGGLHSPAATGPVDPDLVVSIGRLERYKGHQRAITALPHLVAERPGARLLILGSGPYEDELRRLAQEYGVADRVEIRYVPPVERDTMAQVLSTAGVVTLLSDYEAHPVAVMEALALGRPTVVLRTSGMTELADLGWVLGVPADADAAEVAAVLLDQLETPQRPTADQLPTWDSCADELAQVYREVLTDRVRGPELSPEVSPAR